MKSYGGSSYQSAYKRAAVNTLDQGKLIVMLYDGAIKHTAIALEKMRQRDIEKTHNSLIKSKNIITELMVSLDMEKGGDIAKNLKTLYSYMFSQLIEANVNKDPKPAEDVLKMLKDLREAWVAIGGSNRQTVSPQSQPSFQNTGGENKVKHVSLKG